MSALRGESSGVPETVRVLAVGAEGTMAALEGVGCVPVTTPTVDRALEELADGRFDCLLVDVSGSGGVEPVERLREAAPTLPLVAFCGIETAGAAIEAGVTDVVRAAPGSLTPAELEHEIRSALDRDGYGAEYHESIAALGRSALDGAGLPALLERAVGLVVDALGVERCGVFERRSNGEREGTLTLLEGAGWETATVAIDATAGTWAGYTLDAGEPVVVSDFEDETRFDVDGGPLADHGVASGIGVAIGPPEEPWGVLGAYATRPRRFTATEVGFVRGVADVLAGAVERDPLEGEFDADVEEVYGRVTDAFLALDADARVTHLNDRAEELLGFPREELLGREIWEPFPDAFEETFRDDYWEAMERQEPIERERYYPFLDRWYEGRAYPSESGLSVYFRDVTDRKRTERQLREERNLNERIVDTSPIGITVIDGEGRLTFANERAEEIFGRSEELMLTHSHDDERWDVVDKDGEPVPGDELPFAQVKRGEEPVFGERLGISRPDGGRVWISANCAPLFDDQGEFDGAVYSFEDITENLRLEEELEELLGRVTDAFFGLDTEWRFTFLNERAEELINPEGRDLVGETVWEQFPEAVGMTFEEEYRRAMETGEPVSFEEHFEPLGAWFSVRAYPSESGLSVYFRDVTERKEREQELELFHTLVDHSTDAIYVNDPETGEFLDVNETATRHLGYSREELLGMTVPDVDRTVADRRAWQSLVEEIRTEGRLTVDSVHRRKDGSTFPAEVNASYVELEGGRGYVFAVGRDVTERKERERELRESERKFRTVAENLEEVVWMSTPEKDEMLYANPAYEEIWGRSRESLYEEPLSFLEAIHPEDRDRIRAALPDQRHGTFEEEYRIVRPDGEIRWINSTAVPVRDEDGEVERIVGIADDVTERKEHEEYLREAKERLEAATEAGAVDTWEWRIPEDEMVTGASFARTFGIDPDAAREGVSLDRFIEAIHEDDRDRVEREVEEAVESCGEYESEYRVRNAEGELRWVVARGHVECDEDGNAIRFPGALVDITERKRVERRLEEHRTQLETLFEVLPVGVVVADEDGRLVEANEAAEELWGGDVFDAEDVSEYDRYRGWWADTGEPIEPEEWAMARVLEGEEVVEPDVYEIEAADGRRRIVMVHGMPVRTDGEVIRGVVTQTDITDRKEMEWALREERDLIERIVDTSPVGIVTLDADGSFDLVNDRAEEILGHSAAKLEELAGDIAGFDPVKPDGEPLAEDEIPTRRVLVEGEAFHDFEIGLRPPGRDRLWLSVSGTPLRDQDGTLAGGVITFADVTERKERELELQRYKEYTGDILNAVDDVFYVIDTSGGFLRWNESLPETTGYSDEEIASMHALEFVDDRHRERIADAMESGFETGHARAEASIRTKDGESIPYEFAASTLSTPEGEPVFVGIGRDISERKAMEEALRERERQLSTLMENVPGMVYRCRNGQGWPMEFVSEGCRELAGYEPEMFESGEESWGSIVVEEDRDELWEEIQSKVDDDDPFAVTYRIETADGDVRWVRDDGRGVFDEDGELEALEGVITDVTERMRLERRLRENVETLQEFHRIVSAADATFEEKLPELLELGRERLDLPYGFLTRIEDGVQTIVASEADHESLQPGESCPLSEAYCRRTIESDRLVDIHDIEAAGWDDEPAYEEFGYGSYVGGKVVVDGELYGTLCFASDVSRGSFTDAERTFVELACEWVATELGRVKDQRTLEQRIHQQHVVADLGQRALEADDLDAFFAETCEVVADVLDVEYCKVLDLDPDREELLIRQGTGFHDGVVGTVSVGVSEETQAGYTLLSEKPIITEDLAEETRFTGHDVLRSHDVVSGITVVVGSVANPWGVLGIHDVERREFGEHDADFVQSVANVLASVVDQIDHERALEQRMRQQHAVARLGRRALEADDLDAFFDETCEVVADVLDNEYCKVLDLDPDRRELLLRQGVGWREGIVGNATVASDENSQAGYTLLSEGPVIVDDLGSETRFSGPELLTSHDVVSGISVIIGSLEDPWGILGTHDTERREFGEHDADFLQSVAHVLANVIERDEHERELRRQHEHLETLNQLNAVTRDISHAILETSSRDGIETVVCEQLADRYQFAWTGGLERGESTVTPRVAAGIEEGYLEEIEIATDEGDPTGRGPTGRAVRDREPQFWSNILESPEYEPWHEAARERGYRSSAAIPIQHEGALYGVLNVYSGDPNAFEGPERDILMHLGEIVGHTVYAVEQRKALVSDTVTELDLRMEGSGRPLIDATNGEGTISFERTVPTGGDSMLRFVTVSGIDPDRFLEAVGEYSWVERATLIAERGDESLFELTTTDSPLSGTLASYGGRIRSAVITDGELRVVVEVPPDADVRAVTEAIEDVYPGTELLAQRTTTREGTTRQELHAVLTDRLTDKQRAALETAYFAGYFDWPRTNTGEEVAELLGLSAATFTQHLRIAERKLFEALFADDGE